MKAIQRQMRDRAKVVFRFKCNLAAPGRCKWQAAIFTGLNEPFTE